MNIKKHLGNKIRYLRQKKQLTQEMLAEKLNISAKSLSQIECGNNFISADTLEAICKAFKITPKALFDFNFQTEQSECDLIVDITSRIKNNPILLDIIHKITVVLDEK